MKRLLAITSIFLAAVFSSARAQISVRATVETESVYLGQSFVYQIAVDGSDKASEPDISPLEQLFKVEFLGGSSNNSQSITIINGRVDRQVKRGYIFQYRLTPRAKGDVTIPSLAVEVEGRTYRTNEIRLAVNQPVESEDFKLRMSLSRSNVYVGEPIVLTVTWYIGRDVEDFRINMPVLENADFEFYDPEVKTDPNKQYYRIPVGNSQVIAEKGTQTIDGRTFATITFRKALVPRRAGKISIPASTVECAAASGSFRGRDFFDDFFRDDFFGMRRGTIKRYIVPSNELSLLVRDLPSEGRPANFAGLVGEYRISASAIPTDVSVGDPITLKIILSGPDYLGKVDLPSLQNQSELAMFFKVPDEKADGRIVGKTKVFTQTIRAKTEKVKEIPPISLSYFDTKSGIYRTISTSPIPITVRPTRVVTAVDAEGSAAVPLGTPLEAWKEGIAYNYEGPAVIESQVYGLKSAFRSARWLASLLAPPAVFVVLFSVVSVRRRRQENLESSRARSAYKRLCAQLRSVGRSGVDAAKLCEISLAAIRSYLGDKLTVQGSTLTAADAARELRSRGVDATTIDALEELMSRCEAGAYAGDHSYVSDREAFIERIASTAKLIERALK